MSKADNLKDFLTDLADAIRAKKGSTDLINPQDFSSEIASLSGGLEIVDMTETTATIEPNKVYVWGMVESLDITLGASTDESDFFAFRFRCSKPTMTSVTVNGATWAEDTELDAQGKPVLDLGSWYQCDIKGGTSALYARLAHYIPFADSNVEAVLLANGVGDGIGVTYKDAAKVTSISTWFDGNADITAFEEFVNFSGISSLARYSFRNCISLAEIALSSSLTSIGNYAFSGCAALTKVNGLGSTQITALTGAFQDCSALIEITLPPSLTSISNYALRNCAALTKVNGLGSTQITALTGTFQGCTSLVEITLPPSLTSIGTSAFIDCSALTKVNGLGSTQVTSVGNYAFQGCLTLKEITLPASLTSIGNYVFRGCESLKYFRINANTPPTLSWAPAFPSTIDAIYVPDESVEAYKTATGWTSYASKIKGISEMPAE